jgi:hypothetical protein
MGWCHRICHAEQVVWVRYVGWRERHGLAPLRLSHRASWLGAFCWRDGAAPAACVTKQKRHRQAGSSKKQASEVRSQPRLEVHSAMCQSQALALQPAQQGLSYWLGRLPGSLARLLLEGLRHRTSQPLASPWLLNLSSHLPWACHMQQT